PNFLREFIPYAYLYGMKEPYVSRIIFKPSQRNVRVSDAATGATGPEWNDATGTATPSEVKLVQSDLTGSTGATGNLFLNWDALPSEFTDITLNYTPAQASFHPSVAKSFAAYNDYLDAPKEHVIIKVGYDKATFTATISNGSGGAGKILNVSGITGRLTP